MTEKPDRAPRRRRPWSRRTVWLLLPLLVAALLVWTGVVLLQAQSDLEDARRSLTAASEREDPSLSGVRQDLEAGRADLADAVGRLRQLGPRVVGAVPFVGRAVRGPEAVAVAGLASVNSTLHVLEVVDADDLLVDGAVQLDRVAVVQEALERGADRTRGPVDRLAEVEVGGMPARLQQAVRDAIEALTPVADGLQSAADSLEALHGVLGGTGDRTVAVILPNNAEQRGGGGVVSVFALGTAREGRLRLDAFQDVFDVADPPERARRVPSPDDYHALWGPYLADTTLWRNVTMSPDGPSNLGVVSEVVAATTGTRPDVVISLDVRAIAATLEATGPARLADGSLLRAEDAVEELLLRAYTRFPDDARGQTERRRALRAAADGALDAVLSGRADVLDLGRSLARASAGRHLVLWSARESEQRLLESAGLAGRVRADGGDIVSVATQNFGQSRTEGNKLDYFARRLQTVEVEVGRSQAQVTQTFALRNIAPSGGLPGYVIGYSRPGVLASLVTVAVPRDASLEVFRRDDVRVSSEPAPQRDHSVLTDVVEVPPGATVTWTVRYALPLVDGRYRLTALPQPLAVDAGVSVRVRPAEGLELESGEPEIVLSGPFDRTLDVSAVAARPGALERLTERLRRFWNEPVRLP